MSSIQSTRARTAIVLAFLGCSSPPPAPAVDKPTHDGRAMYEGRPIAETCSYLGADWLDRPEREGREQPERVLDLLDIRPGMTVADVGAGTGYFTVRMSKRVGAKGEVMATELQPEMLRILDHRVSAAGIRTCA
jgi:predicted O-methyltransferase YrrM